MEENLVHHNLDFLKILGRYTLDSKMLVCQKYSSRIMSRSMVDLNKACEENIMPWEIEAFAAYSIGWPFLRRQSVSDSLAFSSSDSSIRWTFKWSFPSDAISSS